ncbi:MAG TPA: trypsin-like peptidase domain-containing protein [Candidatus Acidoferrum sp.]|nr:trypsin-like peptidase domain-containing protein [Candidatus Acidoferrum sp.]
MKSLFSAVFVFLLGAILPVCSAQVATRSAPPPQAEQQPPATATAPTPPTAEQIRKTVAFLMVAFKNGAVEGGVIGTCFFVVVPDKRLGENQGFVYLVTNRHVAEPGVDLGTPYEVQAVFVRMNLIAPEGGIQSVQERIPLGGRIRWLFPSDDGVDLAILPIAPDQKVIAYAPIPSTIIVSAEELKTGEVGVGDPVTFAGYFSNFPGRSRMEPIIREGVVAMAPEEKFTTTLHKQGHLLLADLHAFHGNSGSPVFVNIGGFHRGVISGENYKLLGVLSGYYPESVGFSVPAATVLTGEVRDNSGIATIVPGEDLIDLLNSPEAQADRDNQAAILNRKP